MAIRIHTLEDKNRDLQEKSLRHNQKREDLEDFSKSGCFTYSIDLVPTRIFAFVIVVRIHTFRIRRTKIIAGIFIFWLFDKIFLDTLTLQLSRD